MKQNCKMAVRRWLLLLAAVILMALPVEASLGALPKEASVRALPQRTQVKVAYVVQKGLSELDENGGGTGYTYEYINKLAQFAGWDCEFVVVEGETESDRIVKAMELVQSGELDVIGFMLKNPATEEILEYPRQKYGVVYDTLLADENQTEINESNYMLSSSLRVAVLEGAKTRNGELEQFMEMNNISYQAVECHDQAAQEAAIKNGAADVMLHVTLRPIDGTRQIEKFAPRPFYIAATKGNVDLTRDIDDAISKINMTDPYYESRLFTQHFGNTKGKFWLSDGEKNYISQKKTVNVLVLPQLAPFATVDRNGEVGGISRFILEKLRADTGLDMNFITVENIDDMPERIKEGDIDIVYGVSNDIIEVHKFGAVMSQPYIRVEMAAFYNSNSMAKEKSQCILATSEDSALIKEEEYKGVHHYTSVEECVKAVNGGRADVGFANSYSVDFYSMNNRCTNLQVVPVTGSMRTIGFGVVDPRDIQLLSIINKRVRTIGEDEIDGYLLQEVEKLGTNSPANFIKSNMALAVGTVSIFLFAIVTAVTFAYINVLNKRKNAQLSEAYAVAKKANQAKTEFLARMSHEMRTPLSAVIGMTNIARDNVKDEQQLNNSLDKIDVASEHLLQIINDVLDMTKINEGKLKLRIAPFDFKQMMRSLEVIYKGYAKENNISLECKLDDRISDFVMGDALHIKQIVINLLSNAVKYNVKNGMVKLSATIIEQNDTAQTIRISVKDTGIGISKESKKIIFEAFERAQAADEGAIEGTGLGLSISQKMAQLMDSKIEVESEPMGGSNFYLDVTLLKCSGENIAVSREKGEQLVELNGKNIMVVDDNSINVMILEKALSKLGAHVVGAQDGKQAVEKFQQSAEGYYSAIFMDIRMPVLGGYEATKQIRCIDRADGKTVKIVAVSANAFADDIDKSLDSGMDAHLAKPIDSDKLYSILKNIVKSDEKNKA